MTALQFVAYCSWILSFAMVGFYLWCCSLVGFYI